MTKISSVIRLYATITFLSEISSSNITDSKYHQKVIIFYEVCPYHQENTVLKSALALKYLTQYREWRELKMKHLAAVASMLIYFFLVIVNLYDYGNLPLTTFLAIHILALLIAVYGLSGSKPLSFIAIGLHALGITYIIMLLNGM